MKNSSYADKKWVIPYKNIVAIYDGADSVEIIEQPNCFGGACWSEYHYQRASPLIISSRMLGNSTRFMARVGESALDLKSSVAAAGIESVKVEDGTVSITYAGLGGGGVGATASRSMAEDVIDYDISETGGSRKSKGTIVLPRRKRVLIGIDDTDTKEEGATWSLVHNIASDLDGKNARYVSHSIVQLFPVPCKTQNCVSTVIEFGCIDEKKLIDEFEQLLRKYTLSEETGMVVLTAFRADALKEYGAMCKQRQVKCEDAEKAVKAANADIRIGGRGIIGATASLPYFADPAHSVIL